MKNDNDERDVLARTIYGEARGEKISGMEAVASVILNRVAYSRRRKKYWWGNTVSEVCRKPMQFSCWNKDDPNFALLQKVDSSDVTFGICCRIAARALAGTIADRTCGATHYHTRSVRPRWSVGKIPCAEIGRHVFYNDIEE